MARGGVHRGLEVCRSNLGPPVTEPTAGLVSAFPVARPFTLCFSARVHHGWGLSARNGGFFDARPGLGMGVNKYEMAA